MWRRAWGCRSNPQLCWLAAARSTESSPLSCSHWWPLLRVSRTGWRGLHHLLDIEWYRSCTCAYVNSCGHSQNSEMATVVYACQILCVSLTEVNPKIKKKQRYSFVDYFTVLMAEGLASIIACLIIANTLMSCEGGTLKNQTAPQERAETAKKSERDGNFTKPSLDCTSAYLQRQRVSVLTSACGAQ